LRILVAEDEPRIARDYQLVLQSRGHDVTLTADGLKCLEEYAVALSKSKQASGSLKKAPFDVVLLDYRMPKKDGLNAAREIVKLCPKQRIIFASAYTRETLMESTKELHQVVELIQKPFDLSYLIVVEDINVYNRLAQINEKVVQLKDSQLTESELVELVRIVQDGLRVAASVKITDAELVQLLKGLDNIKSSAQAE
jgi:CheY-like chemotaxis protein